MALISYNQHMEGLAKAVATYPCLNDKQLIIIFR